MNSENIEAVANEACFSTNQAVKFQAEQIFMDFTFNLQTADYSQILENYSQTVLFVFLSYLNKKVQKSHQVIQIFTELKSHAISWFQTDASMKRPNQAECLKSYVMNTFGMVLGTCMKFIFLNQQKHKDLIYYLRNQENSLFKLFLHKNFIDSVTTIDNELQYVHYRTLVFSFQEQFIPQILKEVYPYFISLTDNLKVDQLSNLMPILNEKIVRPHYDLFRPEEKAICDLIFNLLKEIVTFKFNITISEYDSETQFENCFVSFPQSTLRHIISKQFLEAFYFMLQRIVLSNQTGPYFNISFQCLKKILLSKITHLNHEQKANLARIHYKGIYMLLKAEIKSQIILNQLFQCTFKLIHAFEFQDMQKAKINILELLNKIKEKTIFAIKHIELSNQNSLYHSTCKLTFKFASESLCTSSKQTLINQHLGQLCRDFYRVFYDSFVSKDQNICGKVQIQKIIDLEQTISQFFYHVNKVGSMDMGFMFNVIVSRAQEIFKSQSPQKISNFLFLVSQISEETFFDRSLVFDATSNQDLKILGMIIQKCFQFIDFYKKTESSDKMVDVAVLLFFKTILSECLNNISPSEDQIQISSMTYKVINSYRQIPTSDEEFLLFCFKQLAFSLYTQDNQKVEYVLQKFQSLLLKLKWALKRQIFSQSQISKQILNLTITLSRDSLQSNHLLLKQRRQLFKIITVLSFDDILDSYRTSIDFVVQSIQLDFNNQNYAKLVFDLSGICENIDTHVIYKYFLGALDQKIGLKIIIKRLYETFGGDINMLEEVLYLNKSMIADKGQRLSNKQLSIFIYELIDISLPFLSTIMGSVNDQSWNDVLKQAFSFVNIILESSINLYLVKRKSSNNFIEFLYRIIECILRNHPWAQHYPELSSSMFSTMRLFLTNGSEIILGWQQKSQVKSKLMQLFVQLIRCVVYFAQKNLKQLAEGAKKMEICQKLLEAITKLNLFMKYKKTFIYRTGLIQNIDYVIQENKDLNVGFMLSLYKFGMSNVRNVPVILNSICLAIMNLSYFYPEAYVQIFTALGIPEVKIQKFNLIYTKISQSEEDLCFVINLKEWLCKSQSNYEQQFDY